MEFIFLTYCWTCIHHHFSTVGAIYIIAELRKLSGVTTVHWNNAMGWFVTRFSNNSLEQLEGLPKLLSTSKTESRKKIFRIYGIIWGLLLLAFNSFHVITAYNLQGGFPHFLTLIFEVLVNLRNVSLLSRDQGY